jgi:hypothetical protein
MKQNLIGEVRLLVFLLVASAFKKGWSDSGFLKA